VGFKVIAYPNRRRPISKEESFDDCVILDKETFDPDAVFMDDIVEDEALPRLSLVVDGLTDTSDSAIRKFEMPEEPEVIPPSTTMPVAVLDPDMIEVYGWESSLWKKIRGYLGF
jgi:hypothetical protein